MKKPALGGLGGYCETWPQRAFLFCCDHLRMTYYKSRNATASQRLWGIYHEKNGGYEAAVRAWRLMPRTQETVRWRALAWAAHHWKWLIASVVIPVLGLLIR